MSDGYEYWRNALEGRFGPVTEADARPGKYRVRSGAQWLPVCIAEAEDGVRWVWIGRDDVVSDDAEVVARTWLQCAKHPVSDDDYFHHLETGHWLTDPPADVAPAEPTPDATAPPPAKGSVPGDNSGDPTSFAAMRANLMGDIAEARAYYARNPIKTKDDADRCENWRKRINKAADDLEAMRRAEKKPHDDAVAEIQARYKPVLEAVSECAGRRGLLDKLGQAWIDAENARRRKEADERAAAEHAARVAAAEAERKRLQEEREAHVRDNPVAALTEPEPELPLIPEAPAPAAFAPAMIGTTGNRRGVQSAPHTATINDAKALALHLIAQRHPDLMECLQKIANAAARSKARTTLPGCRMSWESGKAA